MICGCYYVFCPPCAPEKVVIREQSEETLVLRRYPDRCVTALTICIFPCYLCCLSCSNEGLHDYELKRDGTVNHTQYKADCCCRKETVVLATDVVGAKLRNIVLKNSVKCPEERLYLERENAPEPIQIENIAKRSTKATGRQEVLDAINAFYAHRVTPANVSDTHPTKKDNCQENSINPTQDEHQQNSTNLAYSECTRGSENAIQNDQQQNFRTSMQSAVRAAMSSNNDRYSPSLTDSSVRYADSYKTMNPLRIVSPSQNGDWSLTGRRESIEADAAGVGLEQSNAYDTFVSSSPPSYYGTMKL